MTFGNGRTDRRANGRKGWAWPRRFNLDYQCCVIINVRVRKLADTDRWGDKSKRIKGEKSDDPS